MENGETNIDAAIAERLRALRNGRNMTLDELAGRSGVSRAMISRIERGEASPTAQLLSRLCAALDVTLSAFFAPEGEEASPLSRHADQPVWRDPETGYIRRNISPANFPSPLQLVEVVLPAGAHVAYDTVPRDAGYHQQIWMQEGTIEITVGGKMHRLSEDDCLAMQLDEPTAFRNRTRKPARYIVVLSTDRARGARK